MSILKSLKNFPQRKFTPLYFVIFLILVTVSLRIFWIKRHENQFSAQTEQMVRQIESAISNQKNISEANIQSMLKLNPRIAFFVYYNQLEKKQTGYINEAYSATHMPELVAFRGKNSKENTLQKIIEAPHEFKNSYLHMEESPIYQTMKTTKVKVGQVVIAYCLPGYMPNVPKSGAYYDMFYKGWMLFLATNVMIYPLYLRRRKKVAQVAESISTKDQLEWLEQKLDDGMDDDTARDSFVPKTGWTELFNQSDLKDWHVKGEWYVKEHLAIGFPWGSSIVTQYEIPFEKYEYEVEGCRMTGYEGFVVLFRSHGVQLAWVLGGWKNTRSEVVGYPSTTTTDKLEKFHWYYIKIEADGEKLVGFLDGRKAWEILKKDLQPTSQDLNFQNGFGVGVWSSMSRFQRIRIVSTE